MIDERDDLELLDEEWHDRVDRGDLSPEAFDPRKFDGGHRISPFDWTDDPQ